MSSWLTDYLSALEVRDASEQAQKATIDAYTKLADRTAALERASSTPDRAAETPPDLQRSSSPAPSTAKGKSRIVLAHSSPSPSSSPARTSDVQRLRAELVAAQKSRAALESQVATLAKSLDSLRTTHAADKKASVVLQRQKATLERKLQDREEELREKARLVEGVQDEMVGMQLELNVVGERAAETEKENRELVARWMRRVGREAEEMNEESRWS